ncbi:hypothetical protein K227x_58590 [Rubripirellula lacrimiformis]|uniref:Uncharacterized protein n=2 Tax=Rubripirellula lacrimiformis TaxID=1930273 RepID=A0A517NJX6_9BACT|nr:hypothetical protein K227x_58590 [Rubripirellula lacrimiformis]
MTDLGAKRWSPVLVAVLFFIPFVAVSVYVGTREEVDLPNADSSSFDEMANAEVEIGGVRRPLSDVTPLRKFAVPDLERQPPGLVTPIARDANKATESVFEAARSKKHPERLSAAFMPEPFDRQAYEESPEAYLSLHVPGRVWQSAQPGPDVPVVESFGKRNHRMRHGESVRLQLKTQAAMPATFTSFDNGVFSNGLTSITVKADKDGVATANFRASSGTAGEINIIAASPVATERVVYRVNVVSPAPSVSVTSP